MGTSPCMNCRGNIHQMKSKMSYRKMKKILFIAFVLFVSMPVFAQKQETDYPLFERKVYKKNGVELPYRIMYPEKMKKSQEYPVVLFLHGMGRCGDDNEFQLGLAGNLFENPKNRKEFPCIAVYPQAPKGSAFVKVAENGKILLGGWSKFNSEGIRADNLSVELTEYGKMAYELVEDLCKKKYVDTDRIYIAGVSMGAYTTYKLLAEHPDTFAAGIVICGASSLSGVDTWGNKVPVWIFHGEKDKIVPVESAREVAKKLDSMGMKNYKFTEYKDMGHGVWGKAFSEPDFMSWMFVNRKAKAM